MTSTYASDELFHLVGHSSPDDNEANYQKLALVLQDNCISHAPHGRTWGSVSYDLHWDSQLATEELIVPSVTCYADIPFGLLSIHTRKYGKFGVALPKWLVTKHGARPVMYIPMRSDDWESINGRALLRDVEAIVKGFQEHVVPEQVAMEGTRMLGEMPSCAQTSIAAVHSMLFKDFLAFIKPFNSELPPDHVNNFYMEREWRKYGNMRFDPTQVSRLVVAKGFKERVLNEFPRYSESQVFEL